MTSPQPPPSQPAPAPASSPQRATGVPGTTTTRTTTTQVAPTRPRISRPVWLLLLLLGGAAVEATVIAVYGLAAGLIPPAALATGYAVHKRRQRELQRQQTRTGRQSNGQAGTPRQRRSFSGWLSGLRGQGRGGAPPGRSRAGSAGTGRSRSSRSGLGVGNPLRGLFGGGGKGRSSGAGRSGSGRSGSGRSGSGRSGSGSGGGRSGGKGGGLGLPKLSNPLKGLFGGGGKGRSSGAGRSGSGRAGGRTGSGSGRAGGRAGGRTGSGFRNPLSGLLGSLRGRGGGSTGRGAGGRTGGGTGGGTRRLRGAIGRGLRGALRRVTPGGGTAAQPRTGNRGGVTGGTSTPPARSVLPWRLQLSRQVRRTRVRGRALGRTRPGRAAQGWWRRARDNWGPQWRQDRRNAHRGVYRFARRMVAQERSGLAHLFGRGALALFANLRSRRLLNAATRPRDEQTGEEPGYVYQGLSSMQPTSQPAAPSAPPLTPPPTDGGSPAGRTSTVMHVFEALTEQIHQTAAKFEPVNGNGEVAAQEMRQMVAAAPDVFDALAQMWSAMAEKCTDQILMDAGAADVLHGAAQYCRAPVDHLQEAATAIDRPHADDIERIHQPDARTAAWDWDRNQDYRV